MIDGGGGSCFAAYRCRMSGEPLSTQTPFVVCPRPGRRVHDAELRAEEEIEQSALAAGLGAHDAYDRVVSGGGRGESGGDKVGEVDVAACETADVVDHL